MSDNLTLYNLFDATRLQNCERLINSGETPTAE
jgi:hypothetical protein